MLRRVSILVSVSLAVLLLLPVSGALAGSRPGVTLVSPMRAKAGTSLTIRGRNFRRNARANTVIFRSPDGRVAFAKPHKASRTRLVVVVPSSLERLSSSGGVVRFRLRVLSGRTFGRYTARRLSPVIVLPGGGTAPAPAPKGGGGAKDVGGTPAGPTPPVPAAASDCDGDGTPDAQDSDDDNDMVSDALEQTLGTNRCLTDTDGDGVEDGYEYRSAVDLNDDDFQTPNASLPYPGKRPYPNPLDPSDANTDYDGDSLTLFEEQTLWRYTVANGAPRDLDQLTYSDGEQYTMSVRGASGRRQPTLAASGYSKQASFLSWASSGGYRQVTLSDGAPWYDGSSQNSYGLLDANRDGSESSSVLPGYFVAEDTYYDIDQDSWLSDDERDEDGDGLTNYDELHGRMTQGFWASCYSEKAFSVTYAGISPTDADSDGDGVLDGADDQDHDDVPNVMELSRVAASGLDDMKGRWCVPEDGLTDLNHPDAYGRVNPFNPCLPAGWSRTCPRYTGPWAPTDGSPDWYSLN